MILGHDVGYKAPDSIGSSDLGQMFEQGRSHAKRMIFMGNHYRDFSRSRVVADDHVVRYTDQPVAIECAESALPMRRLDQLANELVEMDRMQREESIVAIMIGEMLMKCHNGVDIVGTEATQRHEPSVAQLSYSRGFRWLIAHDSSRCRLDGPAAHDVISGPRDSAGALDPRSCDVGPRTVPATRLRVGC